MKKIRDRRDYMKKWHATHKEHEKKYRLVNDKHRKEYNDNYRKVYKEQIKEKDKIYRQKNREKENIRQKLWSQKNPEKLKLIQIRHYPKKKEYYIKNRDYFQKLNYMNKKNRLLNDPNFKLKELLCHRIYMGLKYNYKQKSGRTIELLGCSIEELKSHLEKQFKPGMNWKNHTTNGWHVDHIIPCRAFNLSKSEDQKKCFHYSNLQPLWWYENLSKNGKMDVKK